jgi:tRNA pseudouridine32 synthase/23S rRNA pseudouridine746 synthase
MKKTETSSENLFTHFKESVELNTLPEKFTFPFKYSPHPLCLIASKDLQSHLETQGDWDHNFGIIPGKEGTVIGKMFGVLVVLTKENKLGYLAAFSGKLAGGNHHPKFVPPVYDTLSEAGFLNKGMQELSGMNLKIKTLQVEQTPESLELIKKLKESRKNHSIGLQEQLFDHYHFLNQAGEEKSLREIFKQTRFKNPPSGAGECAAPKLLHYAFQHHMKPVAMAEFWWGLSPKSDFWKHGAFYPACKEKCEPILGHMLSGMLVDEKPT